MRHFMTCLGIVFLLVSMDAEAQKHSLTVTKTNTVQRDFKTILIVGSGLMETRAFLEMLAENLIATLKGSNVDATFYFKSKEDALVETEMNHSLRDSFEAIIAFKPFDSLHYSQLNYKRKTGIYFPDAGSQTYNRYSRKLVFEDTFDIQLYTLQNVSDIIWAATLEVEGDFYKKPQTEAIVKKIISSLKSNTVLM